MEEKERMYGHKKMIVWQMGDKLDLLVQKILNKIPRYEYKLKNQLDSASDSVVSNFVEGYYSGSLAEYIRFCGYGKRSIAEVQHRIVRIYRKNYITKEECKTAEKTAAQTMYLFDRLINSLVKKKTEDKSNKGAKAFRGSRTRKAS